MNRTQLAIVAALAGVVALATWRARVVARRHRRMNPQSAAYVLLETFGRDWALPPETRLATEFPEVPAATREQWGRDFAAVDEVVWAFARAGALAAQRGSFEQLLRERFAFVDRQSLLTAWLTASYRAAHEGYARAPQPLPPELQRP